MTTTQAIFLRRLAQPGTVAESCRRSTVVYIVRGGCPVADAYRQTLEACARRGWVESDESGRYWTISGAGWEALGDTYELSEAAWEAVGVMLGCARMLLRERDGSGYILPLFGGPTRVSAADAAALEAAGFIIAFHRDRPVGPWNATFHARDAWQARQGTPVRSSGQPAAVNC